MGAGIALLYIFTSCALICGFYIWYANHEKQMKISKERKVIEKDWLSRDYDDVPLVNCCPKCGSKAHVTTSVEIPSILSEPGKLEFNKYNMRIFYSIRCNSCSLGTSNREEIAEVIKDWNSQRMIES